MDYGTKMALQRARKKQAAKNDATPPEKPRAASTQPPKCTEYPLRKKRKEPITPAPIDWDNATTDHASDHLTRALDRDMPKLQLLSMPPGFGKTAVAVATAGKIQQKSDHTTLPLIVITASSILKKGGWQATIASWNKDHPDNQLDPLIMDTFERFSKMLAHPDTLKNIVRTMRKDGLVILDEVQAYKNPVSKRSKQLQKIPHLKKVGLSATPLDNNVPIDAASYLIMAGYYKNKTRFMEETRLSSYLDYWGDPDVYDDNGHISTDLWPEYEDIKKKLSSVIYAPDVTSVARDMPHVDNHLIRLNTAGNDQLGEHVTSLANAYKKRYFDSVTDYLLALTQRIYTDPDRLDHICSIVSDPETTQPLIFYHHTVVKDAILDRFREEGISWQEVSGQSSIHKVDDDNPDPIVIQYQSGGVGVEFKNSNTSIFAQNQGSYSQMRQARGRNTRRGMQHKVHHYWLLSTQAYDQVVFNRVQKREELSQETLEEIALMAGGVDRLDEHAKKPKRKA